MDTGAPVTCLEASLSNGKTVYQGGVGWVTAVISGLGMAASAFASGLGHSNTAAHVAATVLSMFGYFQSQAIFGMTAVGMPPIVESWTQNFQWSMGIIRLGFLQTIATWYQRSTGGTASTLLSDLSTTSVQLLRRRKRSLDSAAELVGHTIARRAERTEMSTVILRGIQRVGFRARIERTNIFLTGVMFYVIFTCAVFIIVGGFKVICEILAKSGNLRGDKFGDFRNGWKIVIRGIMFRVALIGFPQMTVLCLWEFTQHDSPAEVILAVIIFLSVLVTLGWAAFKVILLAKRSVAMHRNPAYILYSDPTSLNKWGFLYVQYKATSYYFLLPTLAYILIKSMFVGLSQQASVVQMVAFLILDTLMLIAVCVLRPWMDKKSNIYNITIAVVTFINAILLLFFSGVFHQPGIVSGVMGVIFFIYNAILSLILLILVLVASVYSIVARNPDTRYQPMRDDRDSFIKGGNSSQFTTELDALGATARGEKTQYKSNLFDDDESSYSSGNNRGEQPPPSHVAGPGPMPSHRVPASPVETSMPLFPSDSSAPPRQTPSPSGFASSTTTMTPTGYRGQAMSPVSRINNSPSPWGGTPFTSHANPPPPGGSPWQRGAGYE